MKHVLTSAFLLVICANVSIAQGLRGLFNTATDTAYITDYSEDITLRAFLSNKLADYRIGTEPLRSDLKIAPNDNLNLGIGFAYKWLGINLSFKAPFLNDDDGTYGKTKILDLASYVYLRRVTVDLFAQFYEGYYAYSDFPSTLAHSRQTYLRPDIKTQNIGLNVQYIFNNQRFSYRAAFLQNEWQKKSAGSVLIGGGIHYYNIEGDSPIYPIMSLPIQPVDDNLYLFNKSRIISLGVNIGYAHTLVFKRHLFLSGALAVGPGLGLTRLETPIGPTFAGQTQSLGLQLNGTLRLAVGYNSERFFIGGFFTDFLNRNYTNSTKQQFWQQTSSGLFRIVGAYRIARNRYK